MIKNPPANVGDSRDIGSIPGVGNGTLLQYSYLENSMGRGACPWSYKELDVTEKLSTDTLSQKYFI